VVGQADELELQVHRATQAFPVEVRNHLGLATRLGLFAGSEHEELAVSFDALIRGLQALVIPRDG